MKRERLVISIVLLPALLIAMPLWVAIGRLGTVLEKTGKNLQEY